MPSLRCTRRSLHSRTQQGEDLMYRGPDTISSRLQENRMLLERDPILDVPKISFQFPSFQFPMFPEIKPDTVLGAEPGLFLQFLGMLLLFAIYFARTEKQEQVYEGPHQDGLGPYHYDDFLDDLF